ncbi:MAG: aldose 1-epimerase [Algibacter sp.]|uniref:aldose 1-epimerase n=1 Tax=Algibacter sp. TaxID=1872428 RepID=UPI00262102A9|nr:aldose 1-epimerase [Algibacter sp.]MDG1730761.1 aldose 1-epimerase [Algibacter sp.]MDG2179863.1 aldose 1-epimerase [Algibacter sp.]
MYKIKHNKDLNIIEVEHSKSKLYAKIYSNYGGTLQELSLNGQLIIENLAPLTYDVTYASSILFPFANRIKDGTYRYQGEKHQFETNQKEENNALHGLVYNKHFQVIEKNTSDTSATVIIEYNETNVSIGFPYTYNLQLKYIFTQNTVSLVVTAKNTSEKTFPFTLGWHPYFLSDNLYESILCFDSTKKILMKNRNITDGFKDIEPVKDFEIKDQQLDDCWVLDSNEVIFKTPKYNLTITSSAENNFLQVYTPPKANNIAIEPTTGVSDSFNNKIGLQTLKPNETYEVTWNLIINNN